MLTSILPVMVTVSSKGALPGLKLLITGGGCTTVKSTVDVSPALFVMVIVCQPYRAVVGTVVNTVLGVLNTELNEAVAVSNLMDTMSCIPVPLMVINVSGKAEAGLTDKLAGVGLVSFLQPVYNVVASKQSTAQPKIYLFILARFSD
jgi:hypothetical protein